MHDQALRLAEVAVFNVGAGAAVRLAAPARALYVPLREPRACACGTTCPGCRSDHRQEGASSAQPGGLKQAPPAQGGCAAGCLLHRQGQRRQRPSATTEDEWESF
ncbi:MAG: hypothetical protein U1E74_03980 [Paenacidovorax caeni]